MDPQLLFLLFLIILSGFFSGAEIALVSLTDAKVRSLVEQGSATAKVVEKLKTNPQRLLITILIGNNLVNIGASVMATVWATEKFGDNVLGIITGILTLLILVFGEIFPKTLAEKFSKQFSLVVARPLYLLQQVFFPIVWVFEKFMIIMLRVVGGDAEQMTEDEIKAMVTVGAESGVIEQEEQELISNVLDFADTRVDVVMTPREKVVAIDGATSVDDAITIVVEEGHSRLPVYNGEFDTMMGVLTIQELLRAKRNRQKDTPVRELDLNQPILIPESKLLNDLFKEFQWKHQHMAIVVNEHGSVTGIATMEDLLEEIVGEIVDESDKDEVLIEKLSATSWRVNAEVTIEELNEVLDIEFDCDEHKTVSYLLLEAFQKIPRRGEDIMIQDFHFFVEKMTGNKIDSVRIVKGTGD